MKLFLSFLFIGALSIQVAAQTVLHTETFESAPAITLNSTDLGGTASGENLWVINNIYAGGSGSFFCTSLGFNFPFTVPASANQPAGITNNPTSQYLHITPQMAVASGGSIPAASYVAADGFCIFGGQSAFAKMSTDVNTIGHDSVTLDLWWMFGGSTAYYGEIYYSTNGGSTWTIINNPVSGTSQWRGQTNWITSEVTNSNWDNQATLRFGFRFVGGATATGSELDPGFAIDDIVITGYDIPSSCTNTSATWNVSGCDSYVSPSGLYTWTSSNTYLDTIPNAAGCDSLLTVNVTINTVDAAATQTGYTLSANNASATYQWLDCDNAYAIISGATNQSYTVTANGSYAVQVIDNGCTDTSACFTISDLGFEKNIAPVISVYPNPAIHSVTVSTGNLTSGQIILTDITGREISRTNVASATSTISLSNLTTGTYFVQVVDTEGTIVATKKLVKQ
jgi:hypothetical protein